MRHLVRRRRGAILALACLLLLVIVGMAAFAIDIGYIIYARSELQNAADASALAGAQQLMQPYFHYHWPPNQSTAAKNQTRDDAIASAIASAKQIASLNKAADVNGLTLLDSDVAVGYLDNQKNFTATPPDSRFPNSVVVTLRRDAQANTPLGLLMGRVFGRTSIDVLATSRATCMSDLSTFNPSKALDGRLLPVALDIQVWNQFVQTGTSASEENYTGTAPDGNPQLHIYPFNSPYGGDGLVSIGPPSNGTPSYRDWIDNGPTPDDLQYLRDQGELPVGPGAAKGWNVTPGLRSTLVSDFNSVIGQARLIPLYDTTQGGVNGYPIVGFAGVQITTATGNGQNMDISIEPVFSLDATGLNGSPTGSSGNPPTFSFTSVQLTQ